MKKFNKILCVSCATVLMMSLLAGCGKTEEEPVDVGEKVEMESPEDVTITRDGMYMSELTGEWIDEELKDQRPIAVMINNVGDAMPQSGIGQADVVYECLVEGGITRLLAVFKDYSNLEKLGPIRSARPYYVRIADEYNGIYVHVGHSDRAVTEIENSGIDDLDGVYGIGNVFTFRDETRVAPHNCYSNTEGLEAAIEKEGFSTTYDASYSEKFVFNSEDTELTDGTQANKITTAFNSNRKPYFEYNSEDKLYYRYQYGGNQIDDQTNENLAYKNVIIQFALHTPLEDNLIDIIMTGSGDGLYATDGKIIPITWKNENGVVRYYTADGEQLKLNPGKTWITMFPDSQKDDIIIE